MFCPYKMPWTMDVCAAHASFDVWLLAGGGLVTAASMPGQLQRGRLSEEISLIAR
jgi:hypothetical protein